MFLLLSVCFRAHDLLTDFLVRYMVTLKRLILVGAHLLIAGVFFPELRLQYGSLAFNVLLALLFLSPIAKILRMRLLLIAMGYRRQIGILMAYLAIVHSVGYLIDPAWFDVFLRPYLTSNIWRMQPQFLGGVIALVFTLPLLFTSNNLSTQVLGKNWKRVHFLVYPLFVSATVHKFTAARGFENTSSLVDAALLIALYILLKWWAYRGLPELVGRIPEMIALKYREYSESKLIVSKSSK
ncbi:MAG: ferric reductase-like transmembrane domain-containing protein [Candidatus Moraniibacteriota bacterium]